MAANNLTALVAYIDQISSKLIRKALLTDRTISTGVTIQTGIKYIEAINILTGTLIGQASACGVSPTGSYALTQRNIEVCPITVFEDTCAADFDRYWTQILNPAGSYYDKNPIEEIYAEQKVNAISKLSGQLIWRGSKDGNKFNGAGGTQTGNLTLCNGLLNIFEYTNATSSVIISGTANGFTTTNAISVINTMVTDALSSSIDILAHEDRNIYMSYNYFNILRTALFNGNYYHYNADFNQGGEYIIKDVMGTGFNVYAVEGMNDTTRIVLTYAKNLVVGFDLENDFETFEAFYDQRLDTVYFRSKWKQGAQVAFPELVVMYKATA